MNELKGFAELSDVEMMEVDGGGLLGLVLGPILSPNVNVTTIVITRKK